MSRVQGRAMVPGGMTRIFAMKGTPAPAFR